MKNIFFFDIDNTLVDHRTLTIPDSAIAAVEELKHAGHTVVIATGRSHGHAKPFIDQIRPHYVITQNGARILKGDQEVLSIPLARGPLIDLFNWISLQGHYYGANDGFSGYVSEPVPIALEPLRSVEMPAQSTDRFYLHRDVYQAWLFFDESLDETLIPAILARYPEFDTVRWHKTGVDIMPRAVNKWTGCQWVMAQTGFQREQAIAFGDGPNDIQMLQGVGLGIAMDNGHPDLKAIADRIAPALHLDGVARMLKELLGNAKQGPGNH
jgi:Cof subfamily protein (haloacid dehalogenase superfamily)